jgi:hypothetical protein
LEFLSDPLVLRYLHTAASEGMRVAVRKRCLHLAEVLA